MDWPYWWDWPFDCDREHLQRRMLNRQFSETELREMLEQATNWHPDSYAGRFLIVSVFNNVRWHIIVEPNDVAQTVEVVTVFRPEVD